VQRWGYEPGVKAGGKSQLILSDWRTQICNTNLKEEKGFNTPRDVSNT